tara:strand:+ start:549 stop:659 length:111 start_codon:yes stop_codon:yes gene_type:complete
MGIDEMRGISEKAIDLRKANGEVEEGILKYYPKKLL